MFYIQRKGNGYLETVDEFNVRAEAMEMLNEYRLSDPSAHFYISRRACNAWLEASKPVTKEPVKIKSITIQQREGETHRLVAGEFTTLRDANAMLRLIGYQNPIGYYKTDVVVKWVDETTHELRADIDRMLSNTDIGKMLKAWAQHARNGQSTDDYTQEFSEHARRILDGELEV